MMHVLDYERALGELLELDDTIRATIEKLKALGIYEDTLIIVTADHGTSDTFVLHFGNLALVQIPPCDI
jgi:arylsulfatase A-like enzyme